MIYSCETSVYDVVKPFSKHGATQDWCMCARGCLWERNDAIVVNLNILPEYWLQNFCRLQITQPVCMDVFVALLFVLFICVLFAHDKPITRFKLHSLSPLRCSLFFMWFKRQINSTEIVFMNISLLEQGVLKAFQCVLAIYLQTLKQKNRSGLF